MWAEVLRSAGSGGQTGHERHEGGGGNSPMTVDFIALLLVHGADWLLCGLDGQTPIRVALAYGHEQAVEMLKHHIDGT